MVRNRKRPLLTAVLLCLVGIIATEAQSEILCLPGIISTEAQSEPAKAVKPVKSSATPVKSNVVYSPTPPPRPKPYPRATPYPPRSNVTSEKSIAVDPNVYIKLCVSEGSLKINGWERSEVRVFVKSGRPMGFKVLEKDSTSEKPSALLISHVPPEGTRPGPMSGCLAGDEIELDVPLKASLNLEGRVTETVIDSIKKVLVKTIEGSISLRNISGGISAETYQGDLTVESSGGAISLGTTTGNILAFDVTPGQIGDLFKARTNGGNISLQRVEHRQIEGNTISGSLLFNGKFLSGGLYNFKSSNGNIKMLIPSKSSFTVKASYGFGEFHYDFPLKFSYISETPAGKNALATLGTGDANVNLTTNRGSISIKKQ